MENLADLFGDEGVVVWFGKLGVTKSSIEEKGSSVKCYDHSLVLNEASVIGASKEIKQGLAYDHWDKYYVCRDMDIARRLLTAVPTEKFWDNYNKEK